MQTKIGDAIKTWFSENSLIENISFCNHEVCLIEKNDLVGVTTFLKYNF